MTLAPDETRPMLTAIHFQIPSTRHVLAWMGLLLILRVTVGVVSNYVDYFPPNFESEFLRGRETYFDGSYRWAFYAHIISGPLALVLGTILVSDSFRSRYRGWHRFLGRIQVAGVIFVVAPSGFWMALFVESGVISVIGFATLSLLTGFFAAMGWRSAVRRRFPEHRRWMWRCFLLLCSAVVLRLIAGTVIALGVEAVWVFRFTAWGSWLIPLSAFECSERLREMWKSTNAAPSI